MRTGRQCLVPDQSFVVLTAIGDTVPNHHALKVDRLLALGEELRVAVVDR